MNQFNLVPNFNIPLIIEKVTSKDWYLFFVGLYRGLPPGNVEPVTAGASPYSYTAQARGVMIITGGTVSAVEFSRDNVTFYSLGATSGSFTLSASDIIRVTYTVVPTMIFVPT